MNSVLRGRRQTGAILRWVTPISCLAVFAAGLWATPAKTQAPKKVKKIDYNRDIRPIISKCFTCHGHDPKQIQAGLRLDVAPGATKVLDDGLRAIVPYHPEQSELINRIYAKDKSSLMPPPSSNKILTTEEKDTLKAWISEGAEYKEHWAFVKPVRPPLPDVHLKSWPANPIDYFVLANLEQKGLKPSPEADKRTLIRRVSLDLTGLPPTEADLKAFLADKSANAYEKLVDRLLASPRYGERMAMDWMDYARYGDSNGYQSDWERYQYRWRDWVINAFNKDMPYDRFTVEQLAGDLLPHPTLDQIIATGFNRNHRINTEGGVIPEEWRTETVIDRVETTSATWLGLTAGCARCHDHKYDPISQKNFYSLCAYFNNVPETGSGNEAPINIPPYIKAPYPDQQTRMTFLENRLTQLDAELDKTARSNVTACTSWQPEDPSTSAELKEGRIARYRFGSVPTVDDSSLPAPKPVGPQKNDVGRSTGSVSTNDMSYLELGPVGDLESTDKFSYGAWINPESMEGSPFAKMDSHSDYRGWDVMLADGKPAVHIISKWPENALKVVSKTMVPKGQWSHVFVTYDGSSKTSGIHLYIDGKQVETTIDVDALKGSIRSNVGLRIGRRTDEQVFTGKVDDFVVYKRALSPEEVGRLAAVSAATPILAIPASKRTTEQTTQLARIYSAEHDPAFKAEEKTRQDVDKEKQTLDASITTVMVMQEMKKPRDCYVLVRGLYDHHGEQVTANVPDSIMPMPKGYPQNRLGLAEWIVDPSNPLTSRVTVNRMWERLFGTGIVATSEDFGTRAEFPSNPELMDWLATEFIRLKWDQKAMWKELVMSKTYRQSSDVTPALTKLDPNNRLLARGPRFRLPAEVIRDQAMLAGGLLTEKIGGPGVHPYQPEGIWDETSVYGNMHGYKHDVGPDLHRRSLYTIWKRTAAPPEMTLFDVPTRESCRVSRARTDTPMQALALLDDVTYLESARALAQRMMEEGGSSLASRIDFGFQAVLARNAQPNELRIIESGIQLRTKHYDANPDAAAKLLSQGDLRNDPKLNRAELAAYTIAASTILNLDETITKE